MKPASDEGNPAPAVPVVEKKRRAEEHHRCRTRRTSQKIEDAIAALSEKPDKKPEEESDALDALEEELKGEKRRNQ